MFRFETPDKPYGESRNFRASHHLRRISTSFQSPSTFGGISTFQKPNVLDKNLRGEVKAKGYEGWIELQGAQLGTTGSGRGANSAAMQEIVVTKLQDSASTALFREALGGKRKLIVIAFVKQDGTSYLKIVLQNTLITSYSVSGHGGDPQPRPMESLSLNFTKITFEMQATSPETTHSQMYHLGQQENWTSYP